MRYVNCCRIDPFQKDSKGVLLTAISTPSALLSALLPLLADLSQDLSEAERFQRLLQALRAVVPCDAVALLKLDDSSLKPVAVDGLTSDTLGRRFALQDQPRLAAVMAGDGPVHFPPGVALPDPYDGLVEGVQGHLPVHDCMGCALRIEGRAWGVLTLDSLGQHRFTPEDVEALRAFASLAAATVAASSYIHALTARAEAESRRADSYAGGAPLSASRTLIGQSAAHRQLTKEIALVGPSELCVLIQGETGVGKELVAQALHAASTRATRPLVSLNCAALPDSLVESELFGHTRGAFTGAFSDRRGKFELANGGTLFLDEVGELPLATQAKLLRVLQNGHVQRLGSDREHRVDVRLIAASNRDLAEEVRAGRLRADFYHRISVYPLHVPPLRARGRDVLLVSGYFLEEHRSRLAIGGVRLDASAQAALLDYPWPGNVRELEHLLGRSVLRTLGASVARPRILTLTAQDLGLPDAARSAALTTPSTGEAVPSAAGMPAGGLREAVDDFSRELVARTLGQHGNRWAAAARELKVDRANLVRLARRLGIGATADTTAGTGGAAGTGAAGRIRR